MTHPGDGVRLAPTVVAAAALPRTVRTAQDRPPRLPRPGTAPEGADSFCWRIDIVPRLTTPAGLEMGTGVHLNVVAPEQAAAELREAL